MFFTLLRKEMRLMRNVALVGLLFTIAVCGFDVWFAYGTHLGLSPILLGLYLFAHILYVPIFIWLSLRKEWKRTAPLWLRLTSSGRTLLGVKLGSALIYLLISMAVVSTTLVWITSVETTHLNVHQLQEMAKHDQFSVLGIVAFLRNVVPLLSLVVPLVMFAGLYCGLWVMTASVGVQSFKNTLKHGRWIVGILVFLVSTVGMNWLSNLKVSHWMWDWGAFQHTFVQIAGLQPIPPLPMFAGWFVSDFVVMALLFGLCTWMLDRKVEV